MRRRRGVKELRNTVSERDCPADRRAAFRYRRRLLPGLSAARPGTSSVADLGCSGSRQRAVGTGSVDPGGHPEQTDGAVAGAHATGPVLWIRAGGLYRALARMAGRAEPTYDGLVESARQAPVNGMDEAGWKVGGACSGCTWR